MSVFVDCWPVNIYVHQTRTYVGSKTLSTSVLYFVSLENSGKYRNYIFGNKCLKPLKIATVRIGICHRLYFLAERRPADGRRKPKLAMTDASDKAVYLLDVHTAHKVLTIRTTGRPKWPPFPTGNPIKFHQDMHFSLKQVAVRLDNWSSFPLGQNSLFMLVAKILLYCSNWHSGHCILGSKERFWQQAWIKYWA